MTDKPAYRATVQGYMVPSAGHVPRRVQGVQHLAQWKNNPEHVNAWLCKLIGSTFQNFVIMALPGQPAAEMLPVTAQLWVDILIDMGLNEEQDRARVETAVRGLTRKLKEWPQVASLIEELPRRDPAPVAPVNQYQGRTEKDDQAMREAFAKMGEMFK